MTIATQPIRVSLLDDHAMVRLGLAHVIEQQPDFLLVGSYASSLEALQDLDHADADVLVLDYALAPGDLSGSKLVHALKERRPALAIIVLTASIDEAGISACFQAGALGVAHKQSPLPALMDAVRAMHAGRRYIDPKLSAP